MKNLTKVSCFVATSAVVMFLLSEPAKNASDAPSDGIALSASTINAVENLDHAPVLEALTPGRFVPPLQNRHKKVPIIVRELKSERAQPWESGVELIDRMSHTENTVPVFSPLTRPI